MPAHSENLAPVVVRGIIRSNDTQEIQIIGNLAAAKFMQEALNVNRNDAEFHRLSDAIQQIYATSEDYDARRHGLVAVAVLLDCVQAIIFRLSLQDGAVRVEATAGMHDFVANSFVAKRNSVGSPIAGRGERAPGLAYFACEAGTRRAWRETDFFREFCRPHGIKDCLFGVIDESSSDMLGVCFFRPHGGTLFGEHERRRLVSILPHWRNAFAVRFQLDQQNARANAAYGILDQAPFAILLLDADAQVLYLNSWAQRICRRGDGVTIKNGKFKIKNYKTQKELQSSLCELLILDVQTSRTPRIFPILRSSGKADYQFVASAMRIDGSEPPGVAQEVAIVFLLDPAARAPLQGGALQSLHGLTDAESRVCELMYRNKNVAVTARELNISVNTAKTHLAHIFRKIGINSQNELFDYLARLPKLSTHRDEDHFVVNAATGESVREKPVKH